MSTDSFQPGSPLSWRFYARDVPRMLRGRLFGPRPAESAFVPHVRMGQMVALAACLGIGAVTAQSARNGSIGGMVLLGLAAAGLVALVIHSAWEARAYPVVPYAFAIGPFIACIILGGDIGLAISRARDATPMTRIAYAALGVLLGYSVGSLVGLHTQRLGWIAGIVSFFALAASAGLILLAYILLV
jgi:hypothetical protein